MNNDLISREALKKAIKDNGYSHYFEILDIIDNAPTVEPEIKKVPIANITFDEEKLKELTDEIVERIKNGEIVLQDERPHGKWNIEHDWVHCSSCGHEQNYPSNFCSKCGADMRGES